MDCYFIIVQHERIISFYTINLLIHDNYKSITKSLFAKNNY